MWRRTHFSRFLVVGSLNTALDFVLFFVFADLCGINPVLASIASSGVTMCMSFYLNHKFVFQSNKGRKQTVVQFVAATLFTVWGVQSLVIDLVVHSFDDTRTFAEHKWMLKLFAKLCGICVSFVLNFVIYRYIFREKEQEAVKEALVA